MLSTKAQPRNTRPVVDESPVRDPAWSYEQPLIEAREGHGYIAFFDERPDVRIDGVVRPRPITPWSYANFPPAGDHPERNQISTTVLRPPEMSRADRSHLTQI